MNDINDLVHNVDLVLNQTKKYLKIDVSSYLFSLSIQGLANLTAALQQRQLPLRSLNLQSCSITHKSLRAFNTTLINNSYLFKYLKILNLSGNRIKDEHVN